MPNCPKCGSKMVLRTARQGSRSGKKFYGCGKYPQCSGIRNIGTGTAKRRSTPSSTSSPPSAKAQRSQSVSEEVGKVTALLPTDPILRQKIESAVRAWVESLVDFSRNNNLLFYKETKTTTLDVSLADPNVLADLLAGQSVSFQELYGRLDLAGEAAELLKKDVTSRIKKIRSKAQENFEERSIGTLSLARGFASWEMTSSEDPGRPPNAPVFIYGLEIRPGKRRDDLTIALSSESELNPVLQIFLKREFGIDVSLPQVDTGDDAVDAVEHAFQFFREQWANVPNLVINDKAAISNFSYAKLSMVQDLESGLDELCNHQLVLALAGDQKAQENVRNQVTDVDLGLPNLVQPPNEFLVLDADSSQNEVINAMVAGQSFAFEGPPGTGKSQTIANSIACLVAEGKKVLFVAEKRAAIDAVIRRLSNVGLSEMVMDFHGAGKKRRDVLDELAQTLNSVAGVSVNIAENSFQELVDSRRLLLSHNKELFHVHQPWSSSLYDVLEIASSISEGHSVKFRFRLNDLEKLTQPVLQQIESKILHFRRLGGLVRTHGAELWRSASYSTSHEVSRAIGALRDLQAGGLERHLSAYRKGLELLNISPSDVFRASDFSRIVSEIETLQAAFGQEIFSSNFEELHRVIDSKNSGLAARILSFFSPKFRKSVNQARELLGGVTSRNEIQHALYELHNVSGAWFKMVSERQQIPVIARSFVFQDLVSSWRHLEAAKQDLVGFGSLFEAIGSEHEAVAKSVSELLDFEAVGRGMIECTNLRKEFGTYGLDAFIAELVMTENVDDPSQGLRWAWCQSLIDYIRSSSPVLGTSSSDSLNQAVKTFCVNDVRHINTKPQQIKRIWAQRFRLAQQSFPKQEQALLASINRKRKLPGLSRVFGESPDLVSALKPCWVMSPLSVSMLRPPTSWFDVVIFDEASQIPPADAITSIKAAKQMVVAGDSLQLPPTPFFAAGDVETEASLNDEDYEEVSSSSDYESILDFVKMIIPKYRQLRWHYRSRDERLIAFSNYKLYKTLIAFPYAGADMTLSHIAVPMSEKSIGKGASNLAEVEAVVDLVIRHAEERPGESLGVIALGIKHSDAIDLALNNARLSHSALDMFLSGEHDGEPFFVKNLERVQGDERDAIILSIGYGRGEMGQMKYTFGPILGAKGERRLNVATTRAKLRMATVATFSSADLDISKTSSGGAAFLREYLSFVESGGTRLPDKGSTRVEMNPFEQSVFDQLSRRGVMLLPQYGVGNYRLDFAVQNPEKPGSFVLAIECDGRSYHSFPTARERDRLRETALNQRGWDFHRIWSDHWFANPEVEVERALSAINAAIARST